MIVNVGSRECGYQRVDFLRSELQHYLDNVAPRFSGDFVEENKRIAKDIIEGKNLSKYMKIAGGVVVASLALVTLISPDMALASGKVAVETASHIDTTPLDRFFKEVYWTMLKVLFYISSPIWAWVGYILAFGGANNEKRTHAKRLGIGLVSGTALAFAGPWLNTVYHKFLAFIFS